MEKLEKEPSQRKLHSKSYDQNGKAKAKFTKHKKAQILKYQQESCYAYDFYLND